MSLTSSQKVSARRFMGYPMQGLATYDATQDSAFAWIAPGRYITLFTRLNEITADEETVLVSTYLTPIAALETAIITAASNLDTNKAAVWERNTNEVQDRTDLFNATRLRLCAFLGFAPGPELAGGNSVSLRRC